jgi:hypothetical protein
VIEDWALSTTARRSRACGCGAGTHPGGEVSGMPGHNAAETILAAENGALQYNKD